ncbi:hypothetical protein [Cellulomonas hominis]
MSAQSAPVAAAVARRRRVAQASGSSARHVHERWLEVLTYVLSGLITSVATFTSLRLWRGDLRIPFTYWGDATAVAAHFKTVLETGWYEYQPLLGAPEGQRYHDFPAADNLNLVFARVLGWFTDDFAVAMNTYFLLGFLLSAIAMVWFLRVCRVSRTMTVTLSVLFAIAPYHFLRGEGHLWLASYFTVPLVLVVVVRALRADPLWGARPSRWRLLGLLTGRGASTAVCVALVATASSYYAVFTVILLATAGLAAWLRDRDWRRFAGAAAAGILLVLVVIANMAPDILYAREHGTSAAGLVRNRAEAEIYALKLSQLLLPVPGHRIDALAHVRSAYDSTYPLVSESPSLGMVAAFGLVSAFVIAVITLAGRSRVRVPDLAPVQQERTRTIAHLSLLVLVSFLSATVGGLSTLISFFTADLRGWNRMSIVIAALCLAITGVVIDAWITRAALRRRWRRTAVRVVSGVLALGMLGIGYLDQTPANSPFDYEGTKAAFQADGRWIATVESELPVGAAVFQIPYAGFPETPPVNGVFDTAQLIGYLHSSTLRWSGAGIKGRSTTDWPGIVAAEAPDRMVTDLAAAGFAGIMLDRQALGDTAPELEAGLTAAAGAPAAVSEDGRRVLYSLATVVEDVQRANSAADVARVGAAVVAPVLVYPGDDATLVGVGGSGEPELVFDDGRGAAVVDNGRDTEVSVRLTATIIAPAATTSVTLVVGGQTVVVPLTGGTGALDVAVTVPGGQSPLELQPVAGGAVRLVSPTITEPDLPVLVRD